MKKIFKLFFILFALVFTFIPARADNSDYVSDECDILTSDEINELNSLAASAVSDYNTAIYMRVLYDQQKDQDISEFISNYYYENNLNTNALLLLINIGEDESDYDYFANGSHASELTDAAYGADEAIFEQLSNGDFAQAYRLLYNSAVDVLASETTVSDDVVYVYDEYGHLSSDEVEQLNERARELSLEHSCGVYIRIFDDKSGSMDIEQFGEQVFNDEELGIGSQRNGIMYIMDVSDYHYYDLCAHGSIGHAAFTDWGKAQINETCVDYFKEGEWYNGFSEYLDMADEYLDNYEMGVPVDTWIPDEPTVTPEEQEEAKRSTSIFSGGIGGLISSLMICLGLRSKNRTEKIATEARDYILNNGVKLNVSQDIFLGRSETRTKINRDSGGRSGGGHYGGTSVSSSGFSHSSGKF